MEVQLIEAIGKLSVEVVAIVALTYSLLTQAKASNAQTKEMKVLTTAILKSNQINKDQNRHLKREIETIRRQTGEGIELMKKHQKWTEEEIRYFKKQRA